MVLHLINLNFLDDEKSLSSSYDVEKCYGMKKLDMNDKPDKPDRHFRFLAMEVLFLNGKIHIWAKTFIFPAVITYQTP